MNIMWKSRWAAVGAAVAVTLGAGGIGIVDATKSSGDRPVYTAIEPCRLLDTRPNQGIGGRTAPLGPGEVYTLTAHGDNGQCTGIPTDTLALELNVTGLQNTGATHFTIWSGTGNVPNASHVNLAAGASATPNSVTTELNGTDFAIRNNSATAHVIIDIVGIYQHHNHDDRYYTKAQVDDKTLFAVVQPAGSNPVITRSEGATAVGKIAGGYFRVDFDRDVSGCAWLATYGPGDTNGVTDHYATVKQGSSGNQVRVVIRDSGGGQTDGEGFHLGVICP